jgi:UPF0716 protein FxsA
MWLFVLFLAIPLIEIALFVQVGGVIGLWPTLLIVVLTALLGTALMRNQGALAMAQIRDSFNTLRDPAEPLAHGAMILFAGALLLTPGFFTDSLGFALLLPPVRRAVYRWLGKRVQVQSFSTGPQPRREPHAGDVIDGEFTEVPPEKRPTHRPSGWTRH